MTKIEYVSFNQNMDDARKEINELQKKGYIVVGLYSDAYDTGNIYEYALGEDRIEVLRRHEEHIEKCKEIRKRRKRLLNL